MDRRQLLRRASGAWAARLLRAAGEPVKVASGWDWFLPKGMRPVPYSGFITLGKARFSELITVRGASVSWRALCPAPGQYDWKPVYDAISEARPAGMRIGLHVKGVERQSVPSWEGGTFRTGCAPQSRA